MTNNSNTKYKNFAKYQKLQKDPKVELWRQLLMLVESNYNTLEKKLNEKDCSYPKFRILFIIYFDGPCNASSIAKRVHVSRSNISTFINRLEKDMLIKPCLINSTEARPKYILTDKGSDYAEDLFNFHFENIKKLPLFANATLFKKLSTFLDIN